MRFGLWAFLANTLLSTSIAATLQVVLLDKDNNRLGHGEATIIATSPEDNWTKYVGFYRNQRYYEQELPNSDIITLSIYTNQEAKRTTINGLYGHRNHTLYLRVDQVGMQRCAARGQDWSLPWEYEEMLNDLDKAYPRGAPRSMSNIRQFLQQTIQPIVQESVQNAPPEDRDRVNRMRDRVLRHLQ